jgi:hypothetical protein
LSFVSAPFPAWPPGARSRLEPAGGAAAAVPSTNELLASPQPTASTVAPPTTRSAIAPPVAANPPEYGASATAAKIPAPFAIRKRLPGPRIVAEVHVALRVTVDPEAVA